MRFLLTLTPLAALGFGHLASAETLSPETSVLRVNVTSQGYNFRLPWQKLSPSSQSSLGSLIVGNKVLVTAETVVNASYVELEKPDSGEKLTAKVDGIDYEANLALVSPAGDPNGFFDGLLPLEIDTSAAIGDSLEAWQFESNGSPLQTSIKLSRFTLGRYYLDRSYFLVYEATGTLQYRDGSYTFPVTREGKLIGIATDYDADDELTEILPAPIIKHFLDDLATPPYHGFPNFGIKYSPTLDKQLRKFTKIGEYPGGIFISAVLPGTSAEISGIKEGDIILEIDGHKIDSRGNYSDPTYGILSISHLVRGNALAGDTLPVKILRDGQPIEISVKLIRKEPGNYLVDPYMFDRGPRYLIMGGLLFQELTLPFLKTAGNKWKTRAPFKLVYAAGHPEPYEEEGREKLVFLSGVLPTKSVLGYERLRSLIVTRVNGIKINHIRNLDEAFSQPGENGIHKIEFTDYPHVIYLDDAAAREDNETYLGARYRIAQLKRLD